MALHINKSKVEPEWYTLEKDKGEDNPAEFELVPLNGQRLGEVMEGADFESENPFTEKGVQCALKYGVQGWRNVLDQDDNEVKFALVHFRDFAWTTRIELASAIIGKSSITDDDAKN